MSVDELVARCKIPRSSVYRMLGILKESEYIETAEVARYRLGPKVITLGYAARRSFDMSEHWRPMISALSAEINETTLILQRVGNFAVCIDRVESDHPVRLSFDIGRTMPLHHGAGAKTLLACSAGEFQQRYLAEVVPRSERVALDSELREIALRGWAESSSEVDPGIWAVGAPIVAGHSRAPVVLSVAVPDYRLDLEARRKLVERTVTVARQLLDRFRNLT